MGKSAAAECISLNISEQGLGVIQINGEMTPSRWPQRHLSDSASATMAPRPGIPRHAPSARITPDQRQMLQYAHELLEPLPLVMLKRAGLKLSQLRSVARRQTAIWPGARASSSARWWSTTWAW
jgi:replicative DNA helicase